MFKHSVADNYQLLPNVLVSSTRINLYINYECSTFGEMHQSMYKTPVFRQVEPTAITLTKVSLLFSIMELFGKKSCSSLKVNATSSAIDL